MPISYLTYEKNLNHILVFFNFFVNDNDIKKSHFLEMTFFVLLIMWDAARTYLLEN